MTDRNYWLLLLLLPITISLYGQRSSEAGLFIGASNYMGDFAPTPIAANETKWVVGGQYRYMLNPKLGIRGGVNYGRFSGDYFNKPNNNTRDLQMELDLLEVTLQGEWHFLAKGRFNNAGVFNRQFSPYIGLGIGVAFGEAEVTGPNNDRLRYPEPDDKSAFLVFPMALGLRMDLSEDLILTGEFGLRATTTDYFDGVSQTGNPNKNDHYFFTGFSVLYLIEADYGSSYSN